MDTQEQSFEDRLSEMLSSTTIYIDRPIDQDALQIEVELSMVDGSTWVKRFTVTNTRLASSRSVAVNR